MATQIQLRRDTAANWTSENPVLASGEVGFETDENRFKIGDGSTDYANLAYAGGAELGNVLSNVNIVESESGSGLILAGQNNNNMEFRLDGASGGSTMQLSTSALNIFAGLNCGTVNTSSLQSGSESNLSINATDGELQLSATEGTVINGSTTINGDLDVASVTSTDTVRAKVFGVDRNLQFNLNGNIVVDHNNSSYHAIILNGDFALTDIQNVGSGDSGVIAFFVGSNADISYDDSTFEGGNFAYLDGDSTAFANAMPQGGGEPYPRQWLVEYTRQDINAPIMVKTPMGPFHLEQ